MPKRYSSATVFRRKGGGGRGKESNHRQLILATTFEATYLHLPSYASYL